MAFNYIEDNIYEKLDTVIFYTRDEYNNIVSIKHYIQRGNSKLLQDYINTYMFPERNMGRVSTFRQYLHKYY